MLSAYRSGPFPNKLNTQRTPASLEYVFIWVVFHSLSVLCYICNFATHYSTMFLFFALLLGPFFFFCTSTFFFWCSTTPFSRCLHTKPLYHSKWKGLTGRQNTGSLQFTAGSRVISISVYMRWNMCICRVKSLCEWFCDFVFVREW